MFENSVPTASPPEPRYAASYSQKTEDGTCSQTSGDALKFYPSLYVASFRSLKTQFLSAKPMT